MAFAAGQFGRAVHHPLPQPDFFQHQSSLHFGIPRTHAVNQQRHHHVFQCREFGEQVVELIHESQILVAQLPQFGLGKLGNFLPHQRNAAGTGFVQTAQQMQQRGFAAARRADNAHAFARLDLQR